MRASMSSSQKNPLYSVIVIQNVLIDMLAVAAVLFFSENMRFRTSMIRIQAKIGLWMNTRF